MQDRYWMFQRNGVFYVQDKLNGKQKSLKTRDAAVLREAIAKISQLPSDGANRRRGVRS